MEIDTLRLVIFGSVFLTVMAAANYYVYRRFLRVLTPRVARYAWVVPTLLMVGELFFILDAVLHIIPDSPALYLLTSSFIGITFMLFVVALVYDLTVTISRRVPIDEQRRNFIKVIFDVTMLIGAVSYLLGGFVGGLKAPILNTVPIRIRRFPFERFTIVQLTDIHVGKTIRRPFIEELVRRTNALNPDMVVITGDLVDVEVERLLPDIEPLKDIVAPTYFILGNHEYFHGAEAAVEAVRALGIRPLLNESVLFEKDGRRFNLVGINDLVSSQIGILPYDIEAAFARTDPELPTIVLSHQPKSIRLMEGETFDLMLSGHTHGGQIFPFGLLVMMDQPYLAGLYRHGADKQIFVSRGTGFWGPPLRVLSPSEITQLILFPA